MAKELPYFKFVPSEWITGNITLCSMEAQGLFINLCAFYWIKDCSISISNAKQRFSNCFDLLSELKANEIINISDDEKITIKFLDEQMEKFSDISIKRSESGKLKGKAKAEQKLSKSSSIALYKDKIRKDNINIPFFEFWEKYNKKEGSKRNCEKKWNKLSDSDRQKIIETIPAFLSKIKDKQYQPYPETYLNQERWNNGELISERNLMSPTDPRLIDDSWAWKSIKQDATD